MSKRATSATVNFEVFVAPSESVPLAERSGLQSNSTKILHGSRGMSGCVGPSGTKSNSSSTLAPIRASWRPGSTTAAGTLERPWSPRGLPAWEFVCQTSSDPQLSPFLAPAGRAPVEHCFPGGNNYPTEASSVVTKRF
jgi:hypothetical protein